MVPAVLLLALAAEARPDADITYAFEPHLLSITANDETLEAYGFNPVGSPFVPTHSVRAALEWESGLRVGMAMSTAFTANSGDNSPVPTTVSASKIAYHVGHVLTGPLRGGLDGGFGVMSHAVGSEVQGGALTYLGPLLQPRLQLRLLDQQAVVALSAGYTLHFPVGRAHNIALWEEDFNRTVIHGPLLAIQMGLGTKEASK